MKLFQAFDRALGGQERKLQIQAYTR